MYQNPLKKTIEYLKGAGPERAKTLQSEFRIFRYEDLIQHFPFRYVDKSKFYKISEISSTAAEIQLKGKIVQLEEINQGKVKRLVGKFQDGTGTLELVWFKVSSWQKEKLKNDLFKEVVLYGKPNLFNNNLSITHPEIELVEDAKNIPLGLFPIYPSTEKLTKKGITNRVLQKMMMNLFAEKIDIPENLPQNVIDHYKLVGRNEALKAIHFPKDLTELNAAIRRLKFEEFFFLNLANLSQKAVNKQKNRSNPFPEIGHYFNTFYNEYLPFELTNAQKRVVKEIRSDLRQPAQMNRLLQGDVGSGKTMVALLTMLIAVDNGYQAALIAPTEILAQQHYESITELLNGLDVSVELLTGSVTKKRRQPILENLENGNLKIIIGTHALLEDNVIFQNLGLAIIDEQHRFGVAQRAKFWRKAKLPPHILVMTATPIPRTLSMTMYGDLDVSVIDELPKGRKPIKTLHKTDAHRLSVFKFMKDEISKGRQIYVVYPLIEESAKLELKDLMDGYESISRAFPLPEYGISIVHGRQKPADKEFEMNRFKNHETQILVATTVIEVGVNVPNASVMIIENSERFGLSQLHQLRGRVGRGAEQSYCILMTGGKLNDVSKRRIQTMCQTNNGFQVAEVDLELRGPGDMMGTQQSGVLNLKIADLSKDKEVLYAARKCVEIILNQDATLSSPIYQNTKKYFIENHKDKVGWSQIS
ncbi:ATP-dependent DNA helicase RecG [Empedobacter falsenii]